MRVLNSIPFKEEKKDPHSPENFGGCWIAIHILGRDSITLDERIQSGGSIIKIMIGLGCQKCVRHIKEWLKRNPIQETWTEQSLQDRFALFDWTVRAHNYASSNAGHPALTIEEARKIWYQDSQCSSHKCDSDKPASRLITPRNRFS